MDPLVVIRIALEIDGVRYLHEIERARPMDRFEVGSLSSDLESMIEPTLKQYFGFALSPIDGGNE